MKRKNELSLCLALTLTLTLWALPALVTAQEWTETWAAVIESQAVRQEVRIPEVADVCWDEPVTRMAQPPGDRIRIRLKVTPLAH